MSGLAWTLAVAQMDCATGDTEKNLATIARFAREAASLQADLVVFPECATTGYFLGDRLADLAEPADGPSAQRLGEIARGEPADHGRWRLYAARWRHLRFAASVRARRAMPRGLRQGLSLRRRTRELPRRRPGVRGRDGARQDRDDGLLRLHLRRLCEPSGRPRRRLDRQQHQLDFRRVSAGDLGLERAGDARPRRHAGAGERHLRRHGQPRRRRGAGARPLVHQPRPFLHRGSLRQDSRGACGRRGAGRGAHQYRAGGPRTAGAPSRPIARTAAPSSADERAGPRRDGPSASPTRPRSRS